MMCFIFSNADDADRVRQTISILKSHFSRSTTNLPHHPSTVQIQIFHSSNRRMDIEMTNIPLDDAAMPSKVRRFV